MSNVEIRFAKEEELEQVNKIRSQVNDLNANVISTMWKSSVWMKIIDEEELPRH